MSGRVVPGALISGKITTIQGRSYSCPDPSPFPHIASTSPLAALPQSIIDGKQIYLGGLRFAGEPRGICRLIVERFQPARAEQAGCRSAVPTLKADGDSTSICLSTNWAFDTSSSPETYYVRDGEPTGELHNVEGCVVRPADALWDNAGRGSSALGALGVVRQHMIDAQDLSRGVVNSRIDRIKRDVQVGSQRRDGSLQRL